MSKSDRYLKMRTPADLLTVRFFSTSGQLKGQFLQEQDPPWTIWWQVPGEQGLIGRLGSMLQGSIEAPEKVWEEGVPGSALRPISWLDLFRKSVIRAEPTRPVAEEVILMTADREVFFTTVRKHFMLQQGQCEFAVFDSGREYFLLKINNPSLWVFNTLDPETFTWFNLLPGHSGIYMEAGWRIHDISEPGCFNQFKIVDGIVLIQKDGRLLSLKPSWKKGESIVKIETGRVDIPQKSSEAGFVIKPGLRKTDRHQLPVFWKIEDHTRFRAIIANESLENFRNYRSWCCADGRLFLMARDQKADRAVASILSDAFPAFAEVEDRVMVPLGHLLTPRLSSERLHNVFGVPANDYLCFEKGVTGIESTILSEKDMMQIEDFVALEVEQAAAKAETIKPGWKFEFKELKKKKQLIEIEVKSGAFGQLKAVKEGGEVVEGLTASTGKTRKPATLDLDNVPMPGETEISSLQEQLLEIDRQLNSNATRADLWQQRSEISRRMRLKISALAAMMNAAVLQGNVELLVDCILQFCRDDAGSKALLQPSITEIEKGRLLSAIRGEKILTEFHYGLLLVFGARFNDMDIFQQAIAGMKTAFAGEKRDFCSFNESRVASGGGMNVENRVELLADKDYSRIEMNLRAFLRQVGCCTSLGGANAVRLQLMRMLLVHLKEPTVRNLFGRLTSTQESPYSYQRFHESRTTGLYLSDTFMNLINRWPDSAADSGLSQGVSRWLKLFSMEKIRETPLRDFFTGELYRPPFMFNRQEEETLPQGLLKGSGWLSGRSWTQDLSLDDFPALCDGKPIARAIYRRFSEGQKDWSLFFSQALKTDDFAMKAKAQRLLLLMVSEFGPHPAFAAFVEPLKVSLKIEGSWDIYRLTMYCDLFRLCLAFRRPIDEQRLFDMLLGRLPRPPRGWEDFVGSAEWIIMCLLMTSSPKRRFQLDDLTNRALLWLSEADRNKNEEMFAGAMTVLSFLSIGILADLVPEKLEMHQLLEKRRVFWIQHAFALASQAEKGFAAWQQACRI
ncbi:MAG TPA: hypothetical protein PLM07_02605 [Candidatus Rifleibacterium sp.]|nr:hypothetical protein [Candidatus Rifleibacterium sp.]HPT44774.1 hypothetical protein [Candidatus Rifleibacterium sp.]